MLTKSRRVAGDKWQVASAWYSPLTTRQSPLFLCLLLVALGAGCRLVQTAVEVPGQTVRAVTTGDRKQPPVVDPVEVQQQLMRFADDFSARMIVGINNLRHGTNALAPAEALQWKIALGTETCSIASGPNAIANLLDMTIFVTVTRAALAGILAAESLWRIRAAHAGKLSERRDRHLAVRQPGAQPGAAGGIARGD